MSAAQQPQDLMDAALRTRAVAAARGDEPFEVLIQGGTLVDVVTGELRPADIGIVGALIASVHEPAARGDAATVIDASGAFVSPGLIDTHMHVESSMVTPANYANAVLPRGVTTVVWDPHEFGNVNGVAGVRWAADAIAGLPLRTVLLAPSSVPSAPGLERAGADFDAGVIADILSWPEIGGIAEMMNMRGVIDGEARISAIVQAGLAARKPVNGHARGLEGADLQAFVTAGVSSDHELVSGDDLREKLRAGLSIELRGSHDHLLPEFVKVLNDLGNLPQTVTLCTDDVFPDDLAEAGGLDDVVRRLARYGLPAEWALRAATLNGAVRLGRNDLGVIAPGRRADIVLFDDLVEFRARTVVASGKTIASAGRMIEPLTGLAADRLHGTMKIAPLSENDFRIGADGVKVRVAIIDRPRFTQWAEAIAEVEDGFVVPPEGTTMIAVAHRHGRADSRPRVGLLSGWATGAAPLRPRSRMTAITSPSSAAMPRIWRSPPTR